MQNKIRFIVYAAVIAAIYVALTAIFAPISYGPVQVRISEVLTVLPFFTPAAIPGLFIGCIIANLIGGYGPVDIIFGSLATLIAAYLTYKMPKWWLAPIPPIAINAVAVGYILKYFMPELNLIVTMAWVGVGQIIACAVLGYPLMLALFKMENKLFPR